MSISPNHVKKMVKKKVGVGLGSYLWIKLTEQHQRLGTRDTCLRKRASKHCPYLRI